MRYTSTYVTSAWLERNVLRAPVAVAPTVIEYSASQMFQAVHGSTAAVEGNVDNISSILSTFGQEPMHRLEFRRLELESAGAAKREKFITLMFSPPPLELKSSLKPFSGSAMYVAIKSPLSHTSLPELPSKIEIDLWVHPTEY